MAKSNVQQTSSDFDSDVFPIEKFKIEDSVLEEAEYLISYFRQFPYVFAEKYLGLRLYEFQKVALYNMMHKYNVMCVECRNLGKTWLTAVYICTRCILYPKTKVIIVAPEKSQSAETLTKIKELMANSPQLREEISYISDNVNYPRATFWNGSTVRTVTMSEGSRSKRANLVLIDEFVWTDKSIIDNVITNFLGDPRAPEYLKLPKYFGKKEYEYLKETDTEIYLSSAGYQDGWAYTRFMDYATKMIKGEKDYFVCDIAYQTAVKEGMRNIDFYKKQMRKDGFDEDKGNAEYRGIWIPSGKDSFYKYDSLDNCRMIKKAVYPTDMSTFIESKNKKFINKDIEKDVIRLVGADIATVGSSATKNDASAYGVLQLTKKERVEKLSIDGVETNIIVPYYDRELIYIETQDGMLARDQALRLKKLYYEFRCDYMVIDAMNAGSIMVQLLGEPMSDPETLVDYAPIRCKNKDEYAVFCNYSYAKDVLYCINASEKSNSEMAKSLQACIGQRKLKLLINENTAKDYMRVLKGFDEFPSVTQNKLLLPYLNTRLLINEMISLRNVSDGNVIKLKEKGSNRKDRYACILYLNSIADELELELKKTKKKKSNLANMFLYN